MSYAVARPQTSSPTAGDSLPSSATVYDFICLFTHDLRRKQKRWQDGKLKYHSFNKKIMVYDDHGHFIGDAHWDQDGDLATGDELSLDRGMALVQVEDCTGEKQQDLTELLDKRAREVEKRRQIAAAKTRQTPRSSLAGAAQPQQRAQPQRPHLPLSSLVQSGRIGRAAIPAHSPFEARRHVLHSHIAPAPEAQPTAAPAPPTTKKRRTSPSPPSKAGFAKSLFGTTLNLSSCPGPELMAARARALRERMLSRADAASTPQDDEETEETPVIQSSPLFVQDKEEATPSRATKPQRSTLQPVTRHPIASARAVMREAEEAGNRNSENYLGRDGTGQSEKVSKKRRKEAGRQENWNTPQANAEDEPRETLDERKNGKEAENLNTTRTLEEQPKKPPKRKLTASLPSLSPEPLIIDEELDDVDEAPRQRKAPKASREKPKNPAKEAEQPLEQQTVELKPKEPRTTLRIRSRQKRGLLMLRGPNIPLPQPDPEPTKMEVNERVAKTPSPEPFIHAAESASPPEEVVIPSSAPPSEKVSLPAAAESTTEMQLEEVSSDDDLPPPSKRRAPNRRTYSPPPDLANDSEEEPRQRRKRTRAVKGNALTRDDGLDKAIEEEDEDVPTRRRRRTKRRCSEEPESGDGSEQEAAAKMEGPRIARLPRKGIRSREIIGYMAQGIESLIPAPFASATFQLGGAPGAPVGNDTTAAHVSAKPCIAPEVSEPVKTADLGNAESVEAGIALVDASAITKTNVPSPPRSDFSEIDLSDNAVTRASLDSPVPEVLPVPSQVVAVAVAEEPPPPAEAMNYPNAVANVPPIASPSRNSSIATMPIEIEHNEIKSETAVKPRIPAAELPDKSSAQLPAAETATAAPETKATSLVDDALAKAQMQTQPSGGGGGGGETNQAVKPRIANPATRGKKAARREDAAGLVPQVVVPFEPVQPGAVRMISTRPASSGGSGGSGRTTRLASAASAAAAAAPVVAKKAGSLLPGFTAASGGTWSRHAHDLLGMGRPVRRG